MAGMNSKNWWRSKCNTLHGNPAMCKADTACAFDRWSGVCLPAEANKKRVRLMTRFVKRQNADVRDYIENAINQTIDQWIRSDRCWTATSKRTCHEMPTCAYSLWSNDCFPKEASAHLGKTYDTQLGEVYRRRHKGARHKARGMKGLQMESRFTQNKYKIMGLMAIPAAWMGLGAPGSSVIIPAIKTLSFKVFWAFVQGTWGLLQSITAAIGGQVAGLGSSLMASIMPSAMAGSTGAAAAGATASTGAAQAAAASAGPTFLASMAKWITQAGATVFQGSGIMSGAVAMLTGAMLGALSAVFARAGTRLVTGIFRALQTVRSTWSKQVREARAEWKKKRARLVRALDKARSYRSRSRSRSRSGSRVNDSSTREGKRTRFDMAKMPGVRQSVWLQFMSMPELNKEVSRLKRELEELDRDILGAGIHVAITVAFCGAIAALTALFAGGILGSTVVIVQFVLSVMVTLIQEWYRDEDEDVVRVMSNVMTVKPFGFVQALFEAFVKASKKGTAWLRKRRR